MNNVEGKFTSEIVKVVNYFRSEFRMTYAQAIGALEMVVFDLQMEASSFDDDNGEE